MPDTLRNGHFVGLRPSGDCPLRNVRPAATNNERLVRRENFSTRRVGRSRTLAVCQGEATPLGSAEGEVVSRCRGMAKRSPLGIDLVGNAGDGIGRHGRAVGVGKAFLTSARKATRRTLAPLGSDDGRALPGTVRALSRPAGPRRKGDVARAVIENATGTRRRIGD